MKIKQIPFLLLIILLLSGCDITYNLEISNEGYIENIDINSESSENLLEYAIPAFYGVIGDEDIDSNFLNKVDGIEYYNSKTYKKDNLRKFNYNYKFDEENIKESNILNYAYDTVIIKKYDHDEDGKKDYMLFTTDDNFLLFDRFAKLESVKINITCHYEIISSNADEINKNVYTWYLTKNDIKAINMVYNPDKVVDYRNVWDKIRDGEYLNIFTISILIFIIGMIIYIFIKRKGNIRDKI